MDDADEELRMIMQLPELAELMKTDAAVMEEEEVQEGTLMMIMMTIQQEVHVQEETNPTQMMKSLNEHLPLDQDQPRELTSLHQEHPEVRKFKKLLRQL